MRIFRIFRIHKVLRFTEHLGEMKVIIETLLLSLKGLFWSLLLISCIIMAGAILIVQLSFSWLNDTSIDAETRKWLSEYFGTTTQAFYTMFECTFTTGWSVYARPMVDLSTVFVFFWIPYVCFANFAMMKIVGSIFLKQIMAVAGLEEKRKEADLLKAKASIAAELREIFAEADTSGNGAISREEFDTMLCSANVLLRIEKVGLEIEEAVALFGMLSLDDGEADYEEFLDAAVKMKVTARSIDIVQVMHKSNEIHRLLEDVESRFKDLDQRFQHAFG